MISKIVDEDKEYLIDILSKLVTYDSTMGNELKAQNFILKIFQDLNLQTKKIYSVIKELYVGTFPFLRESS